MNGERRVAVLQPLPGIGDMIWHVPHIRAIAEHVGAPVTLIAKPRSAADNLLSAEPSVRDVMWLDRNPEARRGRHDGPFGLWRLIADLRARRFEAVYLLHHSRTLAFAAMLAGIPARYGYGFRLQRPFLSRKPFLAAGVLRLHPHEQATAWLAAAGIRLAQPEPRLPIAPAARDAVRRRLGAAANGAVAFGIGSSEPYKQWGAERFAALARALIDSGWPRLILIGGKPEEALAADIISRLDAPDSPVITALGWDLAELAALLADTAFYVGNDTGAMNLAAAVGTSAYGLFGGTPPIHHSRLLIPILPKGGYPDRTTGMAQISVDAVLSVLPSDQWQAQPAVGPRSARTM